MKKLALFLSCLAVAWSVQAQNIPNGSTWFDGFNMYEATRQDNGKIQFYSMNEGEETIYELAPISGKSGQYSIVLTSDTVSDPGDFLDLTAKMMQQDGITALAVYNKDNRLTDLFEKTDKSLYDIVFERWRPTIMGTFSCKSPDGGTVGIIVGEKTVMVAGHAARYEVPTLNGYPLDVLDVQDGPWKGCWHFVKTAEGFNVYKVTMNEYGLYDEVDGKPWVLTWADPDKGRWDFASQVIIRTSGYKKSTLRVMRNAILAKHGYVFNSPDLKQLFESQLWYEPAGNNASVKLSFIEQMNVALIQYAESKNDGTWWVSEEDPGVKRED